MFGSIKGAVEKVLSWAEELFAGYGPDLINNGQFEKVELPNNNKDATSLTLSVNDTQISNWKVSNRWVIWLKKGNSRNIDPAADGLMCFVDLADQTFAWTDDLNNGLIGGGVLSDPFPTQAGRRYLLQMLIGSQIPLAVQVDYGGKSAGRLDHPGGSGIYWLRRSMVFIAPGPQTQVDIRGWIPKDLMDRGSQSNNASFLGVDYVSVQLMWRKSPVQWLVSGKRLPP